MGVYIPNMEMPENCRACPMHFYDMRIKTPTERYICTRKPTARLIDPERKRQPWCPLVEVKTPHGRLIDADELESKMIKTYRYFNVKFDLAEAETIIEGEV